MQQKSYSRSILIGVFAVLTFAICGASAQAADTTWIDGVGDWFSSANWNNGVPNSSVDTYVNNTGTAQISSSNANAATLTLGLNLGDSGTVTVDGADASLVLPCTYFDTPTGMFPGLISVGYQGTGTLTIKNGGNVSSEWGYIAALSGELGISNGTVTVDGADSKWTLSSPCGSPARLFVGGSFVAGVGDDPGGTALLSVTTGGLVDVYNYANQTSVLVGPSGTIMGNGTITTHGVNPSDYVSYVTAIQGTLAPTGELNISQDLAVTSSGTMLCHVTPGNPDNVKVGGTANLRGRVSVIMTGTFTSDITEYTLLEADSGWQFSNRFDTISITYPTGQHFRPKIIYDDNIPFRVILKLVFTP